MERASRSGTAGSYRVEEVAEATQENHWFQLYPIGADERIGKLVDRAQAAGYSALFVTVDVPTLGNREGEKRWNFTMPWTVTPGRVLHMAKGPAMGVRSSPSQAHRGNPFHR